MQTFGEWLEYYNNLDVTPFLKALEKMKAFYTNIDDDIFKDAVSLPGVSMQYILRRTLRDRNAPELYAPGKEAYEMLKAAVVGGPSLVLTRKHVAGKTRIRSHKYKDFAFLVKRILGFDANSLYQLAKLRMLQFYYDFLDKYIDRRDFELIQMDTDSFYFALSHDTLEEAVKPELLEEFEREKFQWLSWDKWSSREPGLFKLEKGGTRAIALCSKCYFVDKENSGKTKISSKGVSQKQNMPRPKTGSSLKIKQDHNEQIWKRYDMALDGYKDMATNRGFRMKDGAMYTYEQHKLGLSAYYDKRWVLEDGIHTEPIEFHTPN